MADKRIIEASKKMDILISSLEEDKQVGQATKTTFNGMFEDRNAQYFTFSKNLAPVIKGNVGKTLTMDVEISEHDFANDQGIKTYTDRKVLQIYVGGQPVIKAQQGGQGRGYQESPERIAGIAEQVAVKAVVDLLSNKVIDTKHPLAQATFNWLEKHLKPSPDAPQAPTKPVEAPKPTQDKMNAQMLTEILKAIKWTEGTAKSYLVGQFKIPVKAKLMDMVNSLNDEQAKQFGAHLLSLKNPQKEIKPEELPF